MNEIPETLAWLQAIIERSAESSGPALRRNFGDGGWRMTAGDFVAFWDARPMASVSTTSDTGRLHVAPLELSLVDGRLRLPTFADAVRVADHRANPECAICAWDGPYRAVIVYGTARELPSGGGMITFEVEPRRIYGIRPPEGDGRG